MISKSLINQMRQRVLALESCTRRSKIRIGTGITDIATDGNDIWGGRSTLTFVDGQSNAEVLKHELTMLDVMTSIVIP